MSINDLHMFRAGSANDTTHQHLWIKGAALHIPQLAALLKHVGHVPKIIDISLFESGESAGLADLFCKHGSDKAATHNYYILYAHILKSLGREKALNLLEIGMGTNNPTAVSSMGVDGRPGASLHAWAEYLPTANIYGADIDRAILFDTDRIKTAYVDQLDASTFTQLQERFNVKYDIVIDDGLHAIGANLNTLLFALDNVRAGGWIIIEDIWDKYIENWFAVDFILRSNPKYECALVKTRTSYMYVVHVRAFLSTL